MAGYYISCCQSTAVAPSLPVGPEVSLGHLDGGNLGIFVLFLQNIVLWDFHIGCSELGSAALSLLFPGHSKNTTSPFWAARSVCAGLPPLPCCAHSVFSSVWYQTLWSGRLPQCTVCLGLHLFAFCSGILLVPSNNVLFFFRHHNLVGSYVLSVFVLKLTWSWCNDLSGWWFTQPQGL